MARRRRLPAVLALLAALVLGLALLPAHTARADEEPATAWIEVRTSSGSAPTTTYSLYKIFDADYSEGWYNGATEYPALVSDGVTWARPITPAQPYGQNTEAIVCGVLETWRESDEGPVDYYQWLYDNRYLTTDPSTATPTQQELDAAGYHDANRVADYLNWRIAQDMEEGGPLNDPMAARTVGNHDIRFAYSTLPGSFANDLAHAFAQSGTRLGVSNEDGQVLTLEGNHTAMVNDGYYVLVPENEQSFAPIYIPMSAERNSSIRVTVKGDLPRMVDQKVVRSSDGVYKTSVYWRDTELAFVGATTPSVGIRILDESGQEMAAEDLVGYETVAVGGKDSVFTLAATFTVPSSISAADIWQLDVVPVLPEGLEYVEGSYTSGFGSSSKEGISENIDESTGQVRFGVRNWVSSRIDAADTRTFTLFYDVKLTDQATFGTNEPNTVLVHLEYNFTGANPQNDGEDGYVGDGETAEVSASVVTYQAKLAFVEANGFNKDDRSTWTPVEDLPYPEDDDRGIIDAHKDQYAEIDFGAGTYGSMTYHKLGERDDEGWFTYDGVGPTVGAKHDTYEPGPYTISLWPAPYLYTHPAEYHGVKDPAEAYYYFNLRSDLDETSSNVSSLAFEYGTDQTEDNDWGKEPAVFTDVETGVVEIVVPMHRRDYTELPLTGMTPDRVLPYVGLVLVVVGSGALALYRRKMAQKAA